MSQRERPGGATGAATEDTISASVDDATDYVSDNTSPLRQALDAAMTEHGLTMKALTVLDKNSDPFRADTRVGHQDGQWFADAVRDLGYEGRVIHLRGLHYMMLGRPKPDGIAYSNTAKDWDWLVGDAGKAARWLGYVDFDQIVDQRNAAPVVREFMPPPEPWPYLTAEIDVTIPNASDIRPRVGVLDFTGVQPYKIVLAGEKSSLESVLGPIAHRYHADLYLPTGYMSDTMIHRMAKVGAEDGRPMVVLYFADCDPDGWHMPITVGRKLEGFRTLLYPALQYQVHRVGLTPDQVREFDLPSTPLKVTNTRADAWTEATGTEQTEIDALASLRPELLQQIAKDAIAPFYDHTLVSRVDRAKLEWLREAKAIVDAATDQDHLDRIRAAAAEKLDELRDEIDAINEALRLDARQFDLPTPIVPEAQLNGGGVKTPLVDSRWSFAEQTKRLIESKHYRERGE